MPAAPAAVVAAAVNAAGLSVSRAVAAGEAVVQRQRRGVVDAGARVGEVAGEVAEAVVKLRRPLIVAMRSQREAGPLIKVLAGGEQAEVGARAEVGVVMEGRGGRRMGCLQTKSAG